MTAAPTRSSVGFVMGAVAALLMAAFLATALLLPRQTYPGDDSVEAGFARDMATHHEQGVAMAEKIRFRTTDPELRALATDIVLAQQSQIGRMLGWLDVWGLAPTGDREPMEWMGHDEGAPMPGMATRDAVNDLSTLDVPAAEVSFLQLMLRHHRGGVAMAEVANALSDNDDVRRLATSIVSSQRNEMAVLEEMLAERGGAARAAS